MRRLIVLTLIAGLTATGLTACGRKGDPEPPQGATWPQSYPQGSPKPEEPTDFLRTRR